MIKATLEDFESPMATHQTSDHLKKVSTFSRGKKKELNEGRNQENTLKNAGTPRRSYNNIGKPKNPQQM